MKINSIRFKASILYTTLLCVILVAFSGIIYSVTRHALYRNLDERLVIKANQIVNIINSYEALRRSESPPQQLINLFLGIPDRTRLIIDDMWRSDVRALNLKDDYIHIRNAAGETVIRSGNFEGAVAAVFREQLPYSHTHAVYRNIGGGERLRAVSLPFTYGQKHLFVIQVGTPLDSVTDILHRLLVFIGLGILCILGLTSFLGSFFARRILRPVLKVSDIADDISHKDLNMRIPEIEVDAEMQRLIRSFNSMIARLEKSFKHVNEFSSHVAHELKTPLAIIRGEIELALSENREPDEYRRVLETSLEETDRLIRIARDLLLLARLDYNPDIFRFESLDLGEYLSEIHEHGRVLAMEKEIDTLLALPPEAIRVNGDPAHLRRLFFNLITNAIRYTPPGGRVEIALALRDRQVHVAVTDTGIGIAQDQLERIFDTFHRVPGKGAEAEPGTGLGLSIARAIARAHQGEITVASTPGKGSVFTVILPLA